MYVILSLTIVPVDVGLSLSPYIAACHDVLEKSGLNCEFHSNGTNIEGEWDEVFKHIKTCQSLIHDMGAERIHTTIQIGTRTDKDQHMLDKLESVINKRR